MPRDTKKSTGIRWRLWLGLLAVAAVCVSTAMAAVKVHKFIITDPQFVLSHDHKDAIGIAGLQYASRSKVLRVFYDDFDKSIFAIPLDERRRRLLAIDWVEDASVSRVWPDRLIVHIRERKPVAFVLLHSVVQLIDARGMLLEPPPMAQFSFPVLSGVREEETPAQRMDHVRALLHLEEDMAFLMKDISEVDATDPDNLRVVAQVEGAPVELFLGDVNYSSRYQNFLKHYAGIHQGSPQAKTFDLRIDGRITTKE